MNKIFIYTDPSFPLEADNVFLSGKYKSLRDFKKQNPEYKPLVVYNLDSYLESLKPFDIEYFNNIANGRNK